MELKMAEIYNNSIDEPMYDNSLNKIHERTVMTTPTNPTNPTKPKISYDDILTSLNMKVNNGKLEFILTPKQIINEKSSSTKINTNANVTLPQNIKQRNNYIYNKYFSDYKETKDEIPIPLTRREYIQKLKDIERERRRVYQIKPNKLFFPPINTNLESYENNDVITNKLFSLR